MGALGRAPSMRSARAGYRCPGAGGPRRGGPPPRSGHACRPPSRAPPVPTCAGAALSLMRRSRSAGLTP